MKGNKSLTQSKTILGAVIVLIASIFPEFVSQTELTSIIELVGQIAGALLAIYGRIVAVKKIK